ncbi:MAG TPA: PIN domain-containing protein, partial [Thermoanaerobaculia bacterium]|nr:PIN domain-containing protein [Thermoanaerobaculia bacterium]
MSAAPFGSSGLPLVIDTSAWNRQSEPGVLAEWEAALEAELLVSCPAAALEILAATRDEGEFGAVEEALAALPQTPLTQAGGRAALGASRELGAQRRIPAVDYLIAAAAAERGFGVLHSDKHFDLLATALGFESV